MNFDIGDKVRTVAAKGKGLIRKRYCYGTRVSNVPLGSKGKVESYSPGSYRVSIGNKVYLFLEEELGYDNNIPVDLSQGDLGKLLLEEPEDKTESEGKEFSPAFNPREEFAVWIRENFPDDESILNHKTEVYAAAELACNHGVQTTTSCVTAVFEDLLKSLEKKESLEFPRVIRRLVRYIERVSVNMSAPERRHYGTRLDRRGRK